MIKMKVEPSPNELLAFQIVSSALGVEVVPHDDQCSQRMVDALIPPDGALEVIGDHDSDFNALWGKLRELGHRVGVPSLRHLWHVSVEHSTKINRLMKVLPAFLADLEDWGVTSTSAPIRMTGPTGGIHERMEQMGINLAHHDASTNDGAIQFWAGGWTGMGGAGDNVLADWVKGVLTGQDDVARKLRDHPGVTERHAFIWATSGSSLAVQSVLEDEDPLPATLAPPGLPEGITHLWIAGCRTSQGAVAWFPDRGWWRTEWRVPADERTKRFNDRIAATWPDGLSR